MLTGATGSSVLTNSGVWAAAVQRPHRALAPNLRSQRTATRLHVRSSGQAEQEAGGVASTSKADIPLPTTASSTTASSGSSASRQYPSLLPPFSQRETVLETYGEGLWGLVQPFPLGLDIRLRGVVAKLDDGTLMLHNPVAPTEEMLQLLEGLRIPVSSVLISSNSPEHWLYAPAVLDRFPDAELWVVPGIFDPVLSRVLWFLGLNKLAAKSMVLGQQPGRLDGQVEALTFATPFTVEGGVLLKRFGALLVSDAATYLDQPGAPGLLVAGAKAAGVWERLGPVTKQLFEQYPQDGKAFVEGVLELDFSTLLPAHGTAPIPRDAKTAWRECFDFMNL